MGESAPSIAVGQTDQLDPFISKQVFGGVGARSQFVYGRRRGLASQAPQLHAVVFPLRRLADYRSQIPLRTNP